MKQRTTYEAKMAPLAHPVFTSADVVLKLSLWNNVPRIEWTNGIVSLSKILYVYTPHNHSMHIASHTINTASSCGSYTVKLEGRGQR